jgi:hypothetical protein
LESFDKETGIEEHAQGGYVLSDDMFINLWIWFVKLSLPPKTILKQSKDEIPCINGWSNELDCQFGYGLYY